MNRLTERSGTSENEKTIKNVHNSSKLDKMYDLCICYC